MSSHLYGASIQWSTLNAPQPIGGICENFTYRESVNPQEVEDEHMDLAAVALTGKTGEISFDGKITDLSTDIPDISDGCKISVSGYTGGTILVAEVVERWQEGQPKTFSVRATHYPSCTGGSGGSAGTFSGVSPSSQTAPVIRPNGKVIFGTKGLTSTLGIVKGLTITQTVKFATETDESEEIVFVAAGGYRRRIQLDVLALSTAAAPATNATLTVAGAPAHGSGAFNVSVEKKFTRGKGAMFSLDGMWFPALA